MLQLHAFHVPSKLIEVYKNCSSIATRKSVDTFCLTVPLRLSPFTLVRAFFDYPFHKCLDLLWFSVIGKHETAFNVLLFIRFAY